SEGLYQKAKKLYESMDDAEGAAKSSRALAKVQEDLHKNEQAIVNYTAAKDNSLRTGNGTANQLNSNDAYRLKLSDSLPVTESLMVQNLKLGFVNQDTNEIINGFSRIGALNLKKKNTAGAVTAFNNAYKWSARFSTASAVQTLAFNQRIAETYMQTNDFQKAIETKRKALDEPFVKNSTQLQAKEITSLADIYLLKKEDTTALRLLHESYTLSVTNGHTLEAREAVERLDSMFRLKGQKNLSLKLYKDFLAKLPDMIAKDSSIADNRLVSETEARIRELESEKSLKDDLIRRKNNFNVWLTASVIVLAVFILAGLFMLRKLRIRNKKIALQSLRREMNPHFIFNSLNSINQFIATNNELEANRYLTRFSTLMRRVMENSKEDFVLFSKETELLNHYLELEKSRFPDKFDFTIRTDDTLLAEEHLYIPGMLVQPHLENAIWHGLRYTDKKGHLLLSFTRKGKSMEIVIEDNGIGIAESEKAKTANQRKHSGRGISNTLERIRILNELYHQQITCTVEDKPAPGSGVKVTLTVPLLKNFQA
ncbi:MAG: histidine kinase, partial [Chitinophagaceae bacterium]